LSQEQQEAYMGNSLVEMLMRDRVLLMLGGYLKEIKIDAGYHGIPIARLTVNADEPARIARFEIEAGKRKKRNFTRRSYYPSQRDVWAQAS
jgi:hypothetical protein